MQVFLHYVFEKVQIFLHVDYESVTIEQMSDAPARRERRILEILYERGDSSAADIRAALDDGSAYSAVRGMLRVMEDKGLVIHRAEGAKYIYSPSRPKPSAARDALDKVVRTFFGGQVENMVATLLTNDDQEVSEANLRKLEELVERARSGEQ